MLNEVGKDLGQIRKISVQENLYKDQIKTYVNATCVAIKEDAVVIKEAEKIKEIPTDSVVITIGAKSRIARAI